MKKISLIIIVGLLLLVGCTSKPYEKVVTDFLTSYQNQDLDGAENYLQKPEGEYNNLFALKDSDKKLFGEAFKAIKFNIVSSEKTEEGAIVKVNIEAKNLAQVNAKFIDEIYKLALEEKKDGFELEKIIGELYLKHLNSDEIDMQTSELDINLVQENEKWIIVPNFKLKDAITGGLYSAYGNMSETDVE